MTETILLGRGHEIATLPRAEWEREQAIARELHLPLAKVGAILDELEKNLFFLTRNAEGDVAWAYPLTVERTPHHLSWSSGERLYAA